ncbi:uncharacterized protein LOC132559161 [Ylistrum balloti]|uniref:uncharacterized protein LOC132559161 n=1 Tax=Ylistrum balloti TaxID=509963 RepID=UPI0029059BFD|nr:uncharacterized protein LOC132559161 [Ylistrum balloti]
MCVRVPAQKIQEIVQKIQSILKGPKTTLKAMQSLLGVLNFACKAIVPGRTFCRRLINATIGLTQPYHHLRVTAEIREDLKMWLRFFKTFNGISVFIDQFWTTNSDMEHFTDSSAKKGNGFGAYFNGSWAYGVWPELWFELGYTRDITVLEFFPLVVAVYIWGDRLQNKKIIFRSDNQSVVAIVNKMTTKSPVVLAMLRLFVLRCIYFNIVFKAEHIPGCCNVITDSLSRLQLNKFHRLAPQAEPTPVPIPTWLWSICQMKLDDF